MPNRSLSCREPLPDGAVLCVKGGQYTIQKYLTSGGAALLYQAQKEGLSYPVLLKEYFPAKGYVRVDSAVLPEEAAFLPEEDPARKEHIDAMRERFETWAAREMRVGQESRRRTRLTVPVNCHPQVESIRLPGKKSTSPYCCILEMEFLTSQQGFWLKDLLEEANHPCGPGHPFGNGQRGRDAVPPFAVTVELFCALLANLKRIHKGGEGGCIHGDISPGNLFVDGSLTDGAILAVSLLDFGGGWAADTAPSSEVFSTPGFCAPELRDGRAPTKASDVYAVGRLFYALLSPVAASNLRLGRDLSFLEKNVTLTAGQAKRSGLEGRLLAEVNELLTAAARPDPEARLTLAEMAQKMDAWRRRLTPPAWTLTQNAGALNEGELKGRSEDVAALLDKLEQEKQNPHVLWGFAGMGKTKMALAAVHGWQQRHPLSRTYFIRFPGTLEALYTITFAQAMPVEPDKGDLIGQVQRQLSQNLSELDLLVIDNFDRDEASSWAELTGGSSDGSLEQQLYQKLCALPCRVLLTTRQNLAYATGGLFCEVQPLKENVLLDMLRDGARGQSASDDTLRHILELVEHHTMTVSMVAAVMRFNHIPAEQIVEDLSKGQNKCNDLRDNSLELSFPSEKDGRSRSSTVLQNLTTLFGLAKLTPAMRTLLHRAMFIGESGISRDLFLNACGLRRDDRDFCALVDLHYLNSTGAEDEALVPHTLIRKVCSLQEPGADEENDAPFLDGLWEFQQTPSDRRSTADIYTAVLADAPLDGPQKKLWAYRAASLYFRLADFKKAAAWNDAMIMEEKAQPAPHRTLPQLYENRALIFRDRKQPQKELTAAKEALEQLKKLGDLQQNPGAAASIYETLGRAYSDVGKALLRGVIPEEQNKLLELTRCADALAFGEDSAAWADRTNKRDYDDRQRACYEHAAKLREERFTFHSSDTFRTYINLAYCAGVRARNEPERLRQEAARQVRWSQQALDVSERCSTGAYSNIGLAYGALGDYAREKEAFETLLVRRRQNSQKGDSRIYELQGMLYLIEACLHQRDFERASEVYQEARDLVERLGVQDIFGPNLDEIARRLP